MSDQYKILLVEDDAVIALELSDRLVDMGYLVLGPARSIGEAEALLAQHRPDAALLDANLEGVSSVPLCVQLVELGVPVAFCTGSDRVKDLPPLLEYVPVLTKPLDDAALIAGLKRLLT